MSLQAIIFCYILMMLATPLTMCLLFALRKGKKSKEVKPQQVTGTLDYQYSDTYEPCDGYWSDLYEDMLNRENARAAGCTIE